ncbi:MAG: cell division protein FtsL [Proteobacteria bacterium]|jgi:cell division protein FtsL|nr:cell division protein FtsL [Pseudomonadota bacterium]
MILKTINIVLLICVLIIAFILVKVRYSVRTNSTSLSQKQKEADTLNKEYTRLQLEAGTYSSSLVLQDFAYNKLGLSQPDPKHVVEVLSHVSK